MLNFYKSVRLNKQTHLHLLGWPEGEFIFFSKSQNIYNFFTVHYNVVLPTVLILDYGGPPQNCFVNSFCFSKCKRLYNSHVT